MRPGRLIACIAFWLTALVTLAVSKEIPVWVEEEYKEASLGIDFITQDVFRPLVTKGTWYVFYGEFSSRSNCNQPSLTDLLVCGRLGAAWCPHCKV